jgi:hypothetical protein
MVLLARWSSVGKSKLTEDSMANAKSWGILLKEIVSQVIGPHVPEVWTVYLDPTVVCKPGLPSCGNHRLDVPIRRGCLDLSVLARSTVLGDRLWKALDMQAKIGIADCLLRVQLLGQPFAWFFQQLCLFCGDHLEQAVVRLVPHDEDPVEQALVVLDGSDVDMPGPLQELVRSPPLALKGSPSQVLSQGSPH